MTRRESLDWFEEYSCGCTSPRERLKRHLPGYCPTHGASRRNLYRESDSAVIHERRIKPGEGHETP